MAAESNMSFHQSRALNSTSDMIPMGNYYGSNGNLMFCDNSSVISTSSVTAIANGNTSSTLLLDSVLGLNNEIELAVDWNEDEQYKLEEGLVKFKDEPNIMKYVKIAATLRDKTVRDVALRCRWMSRKRRKQEESNLGRKGNYRKDKFGESSTKTNLSSASVPNIASYSVPMNQINQSQRTKCEVFSRKAKQLLEQNFQAFTQINNNLSSFKLQDNIDLLCHARNNINNITAILDNMKEYSSKIQMQEFSLSIDHDLASSILPDTTTVPTTGMHSVIQPK